MCVARQFFDNPTIFLLQTFSRLRGMNGAGTRENRSGKGNINALRCPSAGCRDGYKEITERLQSDQKLARFWAEVRDERIAPLAAELRRRFEPGTESAPGASIRKRKSHDRPAINFALHDGRAAVKIHDGFHQGQAQT